VFPEKYACEDSITSTSFFRTFSPVVLMPTEPSIKRTVAFSDGQNFFHHAKAAFGYPFANYDPHKLAEHVCAIEEWQLIDIHFCTGCSSSPSFISLL
jgi:hypothetical protein